VADEVHDLRAARPFAGLIFVARGIRLVPAAVGPRRCRWHWGTSAGGCSGAGSGSGGRRRRRREQRQQPERWHLHQAGRTKSILGPRPHEGIFPLHLQLLGLGKCVRAFT
jgi:hypothetical protein